MRVPDARPIFPMTPHALKADTSLSDAAKTLVDALLFYAYPGDVCTASDATLGEYCGKSPASIQRLLRELEGQRKKGPSGRPYVVDHRFKPTRSNMGGRELILNWIQHPEILPPPPIRRTKAHSEMRDPSGSNGHSKMSDPVLLSAAPSLRNERPPHSKMREQGHSKMSDKEEWGEEKRKNPSIDRSSLQSKAADADRSIDTSSPPPEPKAQKTELVDTSWPVNEREQFVETLTVALGKHAVSHSWSEQVRRTEAEQFAASTPWFQLWREACWLIGNDGDGIIKKPAPWLRAVAKRGIDKPFLLAKAQAGLQAEDADRQRAKAESDAEHALSEQLVDLPDEEFAALKQLAEMYCGGDTVEALRRCTERSPSSCLATKEKERKDQEDRKRLAEQAKAAEEAEFARHREAWDHFQHANPNGARVIRDKARQRAKDGPDSFSLAWYEQNDPAYARERLEKFEVKAFRESRYWKSFEAGAPPSSPEPTFPAPTITAHPDIHSPMRDTIPFADAASSVSQDSAGLRPVCDVIGRVVHAIDQRHETTIQVG